MAVTHNEAASRFEAPSEAGLALLEYRLSGDSIVFFHTEVPPAMRGRNIGATLVREGLRYAKGAGLKVVPQCPFVAAYVRRHPQEA